MSLGTITSASAQSPRHLVLRALGKKDDTGQAKAATDHDDTSLGPGEQQLFSFFRPSLECGQYIVSTSQTINIKGAAEPVLKTGEQEFTVKAPRFKLPDSAIKSVYPPNGYSVSAETLPHIVFSDPYLPWERVASHQIKPSSTCTIPWLALLSFTADELKLLPEAMAGDNSIFKNVKTPRPLVQDSNWAISVPLDQISALLNCQTPIDYHPGDDTDSPTASLLFLKPTLFTHMFPTNIGGKSDDTPAYPDLSGYGLLSHVRKLNTQGMAEAGTDECAYYSLTVCPRAGPLTETAPTTVFVHLVSLEGLEALKSPTSDSKGYIALASLHSWTYTCLPPGSFDVKLLMQHLGHTLGMLRAPLPDATSIKDDPNKQYVSQRMEDGYSLVEYIMQTGEATTGIFRGALTPTLNPHPISAGWTLNSDCGMDLQIWDEKLGLVDITYHAAWQLGKTLAIADQSFAAALGRLRIAVHAMAMNRAKASLLRQLGVYASRKEALEKAPMVVATLIALTESMKEDDYPDTAEHDLLNRWTGKVQQPIDLSLKNKDLEQKYTMGALEAAEELAQSADPNDETIYNELNEAKSSDWQAVLAWILDRMYLSGIPSEYLVVDALHTPPESLRFFHIDANWIDAFLDGALSAGNHLEKRFDKVRLAIKRLVNNYLKTPLPDTNNPPPVPTFGFIMRSDIISHFPDLRVEAEYSPPRNVQSTPSILRQINVANGALMCLLDAAPYASNPVSRLIGLKFTQPGHQQSFVVGDHLDARTLRTAYERIYTYDSDGMPQEESDKSEPLCPDETLYNPAMTLPLPTSGEPQQPQQPASPPIFIWGPSNEVRMLQLPVFADILFQRLRDHMPKGKFQSTTATSAIVGMQLSRKVCELRIASSKTDPLPLAGPRTLWVPPLPLPLPQPKAQPSSNEPAPSQACQSNLPSRPTVAPVPPARQRRRLKEMVPPDQPPNQNAAKPPSSDLPGLAQSRKPDYIDDGPASLPSFTLQVFPVGSAPAVGGKGEEETPEGLPTIPMARRQDLVFAIKLSNPRLVGSYYVKELHVMVPLGNPMAKYGPATLMREYRGPGPEVISNMRFNVISYTDPNNEYMLFRLIPRLAKGGGLPFSKAQEVSFVLGLVDVNKFSYDASEGGRVVRITLTEIFKTDPDVDIAPISKKFVALLKDDSMPSS